MLAFGIVGLWIVGLLLLLVAAVFGGDEKYFVAMKDFASMSGGIVGTIIGYYFGVSRTTEAP